MSNNSTEAARLKSIFTLVFTAQRYASAVYGVVMCLSVRPSVIRRYFIRTAELGITRTTPCILVF